MSDTWENDGDAQDQAEVFDEENLTEDGVDIAHPDLGLDVFDVTSDDEDADEDEDADDDFDPDTADDDEIDVMLERDEGVDSAAEDPSDQADLVRDGDSSPADYETRVSDGDDLDPAGLDEEDDDDRVDADLEDTFPASDPAPTSPGSD